MRRLLNIQLVNFYLQISLATLWFAVLFGRGVD